MSGHAGAGEYGTDTVCAALSILLYALIDAGAAGTLAPGAAELSLPACDVGVALRGFRLLAENFPENVCYKEL